ncbi:DNAj [Anaeramoeba flamelloides]|uniref:DNAj n=1 Tax=Anaeramoeba flamelloides TaxID=1746091 RepID=A0ABQ8XV48_9EUKA|nr:DNAj [Anaeramoeba flamelloides]
MNNYLKCHKNNRFFSLQRNTKKKCLKNKIIIEKRGLQSQKEQKNPDEWKEEIKELKQAILKKEEECKLLAEKGLEAHKKYLKVQKKLISYKSIGNNLDINNVQKKDLQNRIYDLEKELNYYQKRTNYLIEKIEQANVSNEQYLEEIHKKEAENEKLLTQIQYEEKLIKKTNQIFLKLKKSKEMKKEYEILKNDFQDLKDKLLYYQKRTNQISRTNLQLFNDQQEKKKKILNFQRQIKKLEKVEQQKLKLEKKNHRLEQHNYFLEKLSLNKSKSLESIQFILSSFNNTSLFNKNEEEDQKKAKNKELILKQEEKKEEEKENNQKFTEKEKEKEKDQKNEKEVEREEDYELYKEKEETRIYEPKEIILKKPINFNEKMFKDTKTILNSLNKSLNESSKYFFGIGGVNIWKNNNHELDLILNQEYFKKRKFYYLTYLLLFHYKIEELNKYLVQLKQKKNEYKSEINEKKKVIEMVQNKYQTLEILLKDSNINSGNPQKDAKIELERAKLELRAFFEKEKQFNQQIESLENKIKLLKESNKQEQIQRKKEIEEIKINFEKDFNDIKLKKGDLKKKLLSQINELKELTKKEKEKLIKENNSLIEMMEKKISYLRETQQIQIDNLKIEVQKKEEDLHDLEIEKLKYYNQNLRYKKQITDFKKQTEINRNYFQKHIYNLEKKIENKTQENVQLKEEKQKALLNSQQFESKYHEIQNTNSSNLVNYINTNQINTKLINENQFLKNNIKTLESQLSINLEKNNDDDDDNDNDDDEQSNRKERESLNQRNLKLKKKVNDLKINYQNELIQTNNKNQKKHSKLLDEISKLKQNNFKLKNELNLNLQNNCLLLSSKKKYKGKLELYQRKIERDNQKKKLLINELIKYKHEKSQLRNQKKEIKKLTKQLEIKEQRRKISKEKIEDLNDFSNITKEKFIKIHHENLKLIEKINSLNQIIQHLQSDNFYTAKNM